MFELKFRMIGFICMVVAIFVLGMITAQYKIFPYNGFRGVKNFIVGDLSVNAYSNKLSKGNPYYYRKKSFFEEFQPDANVIMLGDSKTDIAEWQSIFPEEKIANYGISGDSTEGVLDRIQQINTLNNPNVFIMLGINDLLNGEEVEAIFNNYKKIVDYLVEGKARVYIQSTLFITERKSRLEEYNGINQKVSQLNIMLKNIANENKEVTYIDLNDSLSDNSYLAKKFTIKGRSLNGEGYRTWSNVIRPYIVSKN